jgi:single-stranded-DNA-specific exonuclease
LPTSPTPLADALPEARRKTAEFFAALRPSDRIVVFCHFDADGLAAGALFGRGLARAGFSDVHVVPSERGESAFAAPARARLAALEPAALVVTDLGVHRAGVLPGVPTLLVDHHRPAGEPTGAVVVSGYEWDPIPNSAWVAYDLLPPIADVNDLLWIAAIGTLSDLGDKAPWPDLAEAKRRYTLKWLKEGVALVNAARRASAFDITTPLHLLMDADHPRTLSEDDARGAGLLRAYRAEVNAALAEARKQPPRFSATAPFALVALRSPCQVHPLIAQQWRGRLPKYAVIAANFGYLPGVVAFSARTARTDLNLPALLQAVDVGDHDGSYGYGHDQASGGHLSPAAFDRLLDALGFDNQAHVPAADRDG